MSQFGCCAHGGLRMEWLADSGEVAMGFPADQHVSCRRRSGSPARQDLELVSPASWSVKRRRDVLIEPHAFPEGNSKFWSTVGAAVDATQVSSAEAF
jgi:hypothetical protein